MNKNLIAILLQELIKDNSVESSEPTTTKFWKVGNKYFIRTVTMHMTGELVAIDDKEIHLKDAAWIADSGRFHEALKTGIFDEVEPFIEDVVVNRSAIVDATLWTHALPSELK